jgi:hypothetical protein
MNTRVLVAAVAGGAAMFLFGFVIHGLILDPWLMKPNMIEYRGLTKDPPEWISLVLGNLVYAFLLAYIFDKWASIRTLAGGASAGATLMFLITLTMQLLFFAFMNLTKNLTPAIADVIGSIVLGALAGAVIGWTLGFMNKEVVTA